MATKKPSKGPMAPRVGHGSTNSKVPPLPRVSLDDVFRYPNRPAKGVSTKKATPGGDNGKLYRRDHPPQPAPRKPARIRRGV
jgi:hypothetical protein